ncbi:MAG: sulfotransferase domain-containing protein [Candidatus Scalindua sp.]|nr:sulfotransferase domain-containing protein [Candidatus Scalindua sp.]
MKPNFIGIGGQRCGTTWLSSCLRDHPEVCNSKRKEEHFFDHYYHKGYESYERSFESCSGSKVVGEFSTSYLYDYNAPKRVYRYNPDMKIIVCLRNPIERAYSQHLWHISLGYVSGKNLQFENALENNPMYIEQGLYYEHLKAWSGYFPLSSRLLVLIFEEMLRDPLPSIQSVYRFLEIDPCFIPDNVNRRINKAVLPKSRKLERLIHGSQILRTIGVGYLIDFAKSVGIKKAIQHLNYKDLPNVCELNNQTRKKLQKIFCDDNRELANLLNKDLSSWNE